MISLGSRPIIIRNVRVSGPSAAYLPFTDAVDLVFDGTRLTDISPTGALRTNGPVWDAEGRWVIPGLWDHHVHMSPWALQGLRTDLGAVASAREAAALMAEARPDARGIRIGIGFRDALWPDSPADVDLDAVTGSVPTYLINADMHSVWLNSAAIARSGVPASTDGVYREGPAFEIHAELDRVDDGLIDTAISEAADAAAARGVVGIVDFDMAYNADAWRRRAAADFDALRVSFGTYAHDLSRARAEGLTTGDPLDDRELIRVGPMKVITDGSLGTGTAACAHPYAGAEHTGLLTVSPDDLRELLTEVALSGWEAAVHAIGDRAVRHALDAFTYTGAVGSLEHAQLVAHADIARMAKLGLTASLQPSHAIDDRDIVDSQWATQTSKAYPMRSLVDAGTNVVFGSDAPVAKLSPWDTIADAVGRTRDGRAPWDAAEAVSARAAMAASTGLGTNDNVLIAPGAMADFAFCDADPFASSPDELRSMRVGATLLAGRFTHIG